MEFDLILMVSFLVFGGLCIFNALRLCKAKKLFESMVLYPGGLKKENCLDPEGFMRFMRLRMGILGGLMLLVAGVYALKMYVGLPKAVSIAHIVFTVAALAWGFSIYHSAAKRFW